jgi:hypothetical protein
MHPRTIRRIIIARRITSAFAIALLLMVGSNPAMAAILPIGTELRQWSDLAYPNTDTGSYNATTDALSLTTQEFNNLELGYEFGPGAPVDGQHYGTGGTLGGPFQTTLTIAGTTIAPTADDPDTAFDETKYGTVTAGGTVTVTFNGGAAGSVGTDYGVVAGNALLTGTIVEALLDAAGDNTLDLLVSLSGGALQNPNPDLGINFAPNNMAVLRITRAAGLPSDWTATFTLTGATIDMLGVPEPTGLTLGLLSTVFAFLLRTRRYSLQERAR